jgi:hypothetical protein
MKHTPGPWKPCRAHENFDGTYWPIEPEDRAEYDARPYTSIEAAAGVVANAHDLFTFKAADARLIAAAPDMLAALEATRGILEGVLVTPDDARRNALDAIDAAIRTATGGE